MAVCVVFDRLLWVLRVVLNNILGEGVREAVDALVAVAVPLVRRRARQAAQQPRVSLDSKPVRHCCVIRVVY